MGLERGCRVPLGTPSSDVGTERCLCYRSPARPLPVASWGDHRVARGPEVTRALNIVRGNMNATHAERTSSNQDTKIITFSPSAAR